MDYGPGVIYSRSEALVRKSSVCVPLIYVQGEPHLVLIRRSRKLRRHPGQISFPGGFVEQGETDLEAALRELQEEIGVSSEYTKVLDVLPCQVVASTGIQITPFLILLKRNEFHLNHDEVEEIYFVNVNTLRDTPCETIQMPNGVQTCRYRLPGLIIWGATAKVITNFLKNAKEERE